ncbi:hypothetical protein GMSM_13640 [Geomonas sp. Red276]
MNFEGYKAIVAVVLASLTCLFYLIWFFIPPIRLVWRCLSREENLPLLNTLKACRESALPLKPAIFRKQMRLWLELRLLHPRPRREPNWRLDPRTRRYQLTFDEEAYRTELAEWRRSLKAKFAALKIKEKEPVIEVADVFRLNDEVTKNGIKEYLLAVAQLNLSLDEEASFLCSVRINEGYLLPLNLLAGLMSRFDDDWEPTISSYHRMAEKSFSCLQMSTFDLWLLWGPSVPICTCDQWSGPITLQYGYGDENNSVRVRVKDQSKELLLAELRKATASRGGAPHPALHASVTGKLWPPSSFYQGGICGAQQELLNPDREAFILEYEGHSVSGSAGAGQFYTAYVWALFAVGREKEPAVEEIRKEPWLHVIPFFEHANIVDERCYRMAKVQLAHKVMNYLRENEGGVGTAPVRLWYLCALDDPGSGHALEIPPKGRTILAELEELAGRPDYRKERERMALADHYLSRELSGCHLSGAIRELFRTIEERE